MIEKVNSSQYMVGRKNAGFFLLGFLLIAICYLLSANFAYAQDFNLIVCDPVDGPPCDFNALMLLVRNLISALIILSTFLATGAFAYAGFVLLASGGSETEKNKAKDVFFKVLKGYLWILAAWVLVYTITSTLLDDAFVFLD